LHRQHQGEKLQLTPLLEICSI